MAWRHRVCMVEDQGWLRARAGVLGEMWVSHGLTVSQATSLDFLPWAAGSLRRHKQGWTCWSLFAPGL